MKQRFKDNNYPFIKMMSDAGIRVVTGTDCGAEASQTTPVGHTTHREVAMFVEAGMTPVAALRAATLDAARVLERTEDPTYGSIRAGKIADLVVLNARSDRRHQQHHQDRSSHESGNMGALSHQA